MKNYLTILAFAAVSFCLICGGCQSDNVVEDEPAAAQPSVGEADVKVESAVEPKAQAVAEAKAPARPLPERRAASERFEGQDTQPRAG